MSMLVDKNNVQDFITVKVTKSVTRGNCFTIKHSKPLRVHEKFMPVFKRTWDLIVFIHNEGDEFWFSSAPYYMLPNKFRLNIKYDTQAVLTELKIGEKQVELYPKKVRPCNATSSGTDRDSILKDSAVYRLTLAF